MCAGIGPEIPTFDGVTARFDLIDRHGCSRDQVGASAAIQGGMFRRSRLVLKSIS
jgi:hypothetical protein